LRISIAIYFMIFVPGDLEIFLNIDKILVLS